MADLWVVLTLVGFFALCVAFVRACDRIIGPDESSDLAIETPAREETATPAYEEIGAQ
jgi:hypothetical protein